MITLTGHTLSLQEIKRICYDKEQIQIAPTSIQKIQHSRNVVESIVENGQTIYGINTGFGKFSDVKIEEQDVNELQQHLIRSHACGVGEPFPEIVSRAMMLLRLNALIKGYSGIRMTIAEQLTTLINEQIHPVIPQQGSLGASGDLAPLSHLALVLIGEGNVFYKEKVYTTKSIFSLLGIKPVELKAKEGLALINGTQAMTAQGVINYLEVEKIAYQAEWIAALTLEGLNGIIDAFHPAIHEARGYPQQIKVAQRINHILQDSNLVTHQGEKRVQDAYSLRCIPQVHGASWQSFDYVKEKLEIEANAATDNPLILENGQTIISGGNFHGQPIALAMDFMKIGIAELASISERRIERLVNPQLNDLPPFLSAKPGLQSGAMIMQYTAASLVSENKTLAHPASVDSIPSSANQEDHVSMGTIGARHAYSILQNSRRVLAIELICAMQALEHRELGKMSSHTSSLYKKVRQIVPCIKEDRVFSEDIERLTLWLKESDFSWNIFPTNSKSQGGING
ncbi:histidine ammonia-lyase [Pontibacillus yanchengensis]|uniref:Histidine ammonia-lyase n=1 Tax=Pontibacillus yanchengensis Y32 TaxID=1385514 RepID=A0A0A2TTX7_9BACI|nr:histidine ammonia-lyase [Pontibacillus yanchengensis]KGP72720.1 histidine ammonia-lyase [Pontibacillus yanchengensis Y32]